MTRLKGRSGGPGEGKQSGKVKGKVLSSKGSQASPGKMGEQAAKDRGAQPPVNQPAGQSKFIFSIFNEV